MKKIYATVIYLFLLLSLLTGCNGKSQSGIPMRRGSYQL